MTSLAYQKRSSSLPNVEGNAEAGLNRHIRPPSAAVEDAEAPAVVSAQSPRPAVSTPAGCQISTRAVNAFSDIFLYEWVVSFGNWNLMFLCEETCL
jgi:hypothetical protein